MRTPEHIFGKELKRIRRDCGLSQEELGFRADIHWSYVSQLERGLKSPSLGVMVRIAKALEVTVSDLVHEVDAKFLG